MELLHLFKQLSEIGFTPVALIALGAVWQFQKMINLLDKRLSIVESKLEVK